MSDFKWAEKPVIKDAISNNDIRLVDLNVKVIFEWSDKIIADYDEETGEAEYTSGYIMHVLPQQIVYNKQPTIFLGSALNQ